MDELVEDGFEQVGLLIFPAPFLKIHFLQEKSSDERSDAGSQGVESDYDVDEEYDNDYAENYFDNGEGDDIDDMGGGGGDDGGGGKHLNLACIQCLNLGYTGDYDQIWREGIDSIYYL